MTQETKTKLLYGKLSFIINGILFKVHNELGRFAREKQYGDLFEIKLKEANLSYLRELRVGDSGNMPDFIIEDQIIIELKAKPFVPTEDYNQVQRYLQSTNLDLALLVNFRSKFLQIKRILRRK